MFALSATWTSLVTFLPTLWLDEREVPLTLGGPLLAFLYYGLIPSSLLGGYIAGKVRNPKVLLGVPAFVFQEGGDFEAARTFQEIARLTKGAYCRFDTSSASQLRDLLKAVAVYAAGGRRALENLGRKLGGDVALLAHGMK